MNENLQSGEPDRVILFVALLIVLAAFLIVLAAFTVTLAAFMFVFEAFLIVLAAFTIVFAARSRFRIPYTGAWKARVADRGGGGSVRDAVLFVKSFDAAIAVFTSIDGASRRSCGFQQQTGP